MFVTYVCEEGAQLLHGRNIRNIRYLCSTFNLKFISFADVNCHKDIISSFRSNQHERCYDFDINRFNVLLEMLMVRDGVIGLQSFNTNEIDVIINEICTNWQV